ncbi:MAG: hypothetical protein ACSLFQ_13245, partial [Thermoanaerobaculia bacterium]
AYANEWLPSRFSLGILRLAAFAISRSLELRRPKSGAQLNRHRQQHPLEANLASVAFWIIPNLHVTLLAVRAADGKWFVGPLAFVALLVLIPMAWFLMVLAFSPFAAVASRLTGRSSHDVQTVLTPTVMLLLSIGSIAGGWPSAPLGWFWIGLTVLELAASLVCVLLREPFAALEARLPPETP